MSNNLKVRTKLYLIGLGFLIFIVFILFFSTHSMNRIHDESVDSLEEVMRENYDARIKEEVDVVLSILDVYNQDIEAGIFTREEGMKLAADEVRELRYGTAGYFWIDQSDGTNVVLLGNDTEGTNRMETTDANGYQMVKEIIRVAVEDGGGYTDYVFPKEGETESSPKRSYSAYFEPFDWVVGTGNYTDFIDDEVLAASKRINDITSEMRMILSAICLIYAVIVGSFLIRLIQHIVYPLKAIEKCIEKIAVGDLSARIDEKYLKKKDDFGILSNNIEKMRKNISGLIGNVKNEAAGISNVVDGINTEINELNSEIEDVSATTEQLAASMEETAATSDEIARMSQEIEDAAKNIAIRAQDGAGTAENIHERAMQAKRQAVNNREMIHTNKEQIKESLTKTLEEAKVVDQISVLAESIMGITEQTNLLSLNASIEAARAGEAGKGFAVVADEIRKLAEQSKENVENIQRVTGAVNGAVNNLKRDSERLLAFVDTEVSESFDKFEEMAETYNHDATEVNGLVADFSATSEELLASISSILESIDNISKATNDGAAGTTNIADKTVSVATRSDTVTANSREAENAVRLLNEGVGQFIIEE